MTEHPPPVWGNAAPPPSSAASLAGPGPGLPAEAYTPWFTRVLAWIIDYVPAALITGIGYALLAATRDCVTLGQSEYGDLFGDAYSDAQVCGASTTGQASIVVFSLLTLAYVLWNYGYRQGRTGSSVGKSILGFRVVSEKTWQLIGFGPSVLRQIAHVLDSIVCYVGYLFPLWDAKRQTFADKIMSTVCVPL